MAKARKKPSQRMRALLQKEIESKCPFCDRRDVDTFEVHHLNEKPDDDTYNNELLVCPICHARITNGTISTNDVYRKKYELMLAVKQREEHEPSGNINFANNKFDRDAAVIIGNGNTVKVSRRVVKKTYPNGSIGSDNDKANYLSYLVTKYGEYAAWGHHGEEAYYIMPNMLKKRFKIGSNRSYFNIPIDRFEEAVAFVQDKILNTQLGRIKKSQQRLFRSFEEYLSSQ